MRKIITATFLTLDGVMQAPGGSDEDKTSGFEYGGWQSSFPSDKIAESVMAGFFNIPFELLLGKNTYDIFAAYWPTAKADNEVAVPFNKTKKYVVSRSEQKLSWENSTLITGDVVSQIKKLKEQSGPDLWVWGSGNLIQTLLKEHLIDQMHILTYPVTIGKGKRLFAEGTQPQQFKLVDSKIATTGLILATYEPAGPLKKGQ